VSETISHIGEIRPASPAVAVDKVAVPTRLLLKEARTFKHWPGCGADDFLRLRIENDQRFHADKYCDGGVPFVYDVTRDPQRIFSVRPAKILTGTICAGVGRRSDADGPPTPWLYETVRRDLIKLSNEKPRQMR
jgi:hypothetical protein